MAGRRSSHSNHPCDIVDMPQVTVPKPHSGGKAPVSVDIVQALRMRDVDGLSVRQIGRKLGVSEATIRRRLQEYGTPAEPAVSPEPEPKTSKPVVEPLKPLTPLQPLIATPVPAIASAVPEPRPTVSEPVSNLEGLRTYWESRGRDFQPDSKRFFLVNGSDNVKFGAGSEQFAVGIDVWRPEYRMLDLFKRAERVWVLLDASQDNREFLMSIVGDIWLRERFKVIRIASGGVLSAFQSRCNWQRIYPAKSFAAALADAAFEEQLRAIPCPQPNHTEVIAQLLAPVSQPERPQGLSGFCGLPYGGQPVDLIEAHGFDRKKLDTGDRSCGVAGTD